MIQTVINKPVALTSNTSAITFDETDVRTRCAYCCNGGWLDYQNGSPIFKIFGNGYTGYYDINFSGTVSSATGGAVAIGLYEDGILIPDTLRLVTIDTTNYCQNISFNKKIRICPRGNTSITVASVPSIPTPTDPTTPVETEIPIIISATFNISRKNN